MTMGGLDVLHIRLFVDLFQWKTIQRQQLHVPCWLLLFIPQRTVPSACLLAVSDTHRLPRTHRGKIQHTTYTIGWMDGIFSRQMCLDRNELESDRPRSFVFSTEISFSPSCLDLVQLVCFSPPRRSVGTLKLRQHLGSCLAGWRIH